MISKKLFCNKYFKKIIQIPFYTWIIASPTIFGYGVSISDIQLTYTDAKGNTVRKDCVQKIHKVSSNIAVGFAGSLPIGFKMVNDMKLYLSKIPNNYARDLEFVAKEWQKKAQCIFNNSLENDKKNGCNLIIIGCIPKESAGLYNCKSIVAILRFPEFTPEFIKTREWASTGCGEGKKEYKGIINDLKSEFSFIKIEEGMPGGFGLAAKIIVNQTISKNPMPGVSNFLHLCIVGPNGIDISGTNYEITDKDGKVEQFIMPKVASNMEELSNLLNMKEEALLGSSCTNTLLSDK